MSIDYTKPFGPSCVRSGFCCKQAPCPYGAWNADKTACKELVGNKPGEYGCALYDYIKTQPGWEVCPAFGMGCSSTLGNLARQQVLKELKSR